MNNSTPDLKVLYKLKNPCRDQFEMRIVCLDNEIPEDHKARKVWEFVQNMNTDPCFSSLNTMVGQPGRPATNPEVLFSLWILAIMDGITSGRKIVEFVNYHSAYRWIAGGVEINRTMINDFRSANPFQFKQLLISCLAVMKKSGLISDEDMAQDGTKIKGEAGGNSYRRESTLKDLEKESAKYLEEIEKKNAQDPNIFDKKAQAAKLRAAKERKERVSKAINELKKSKEEKIKNNKKNHKGKVKQKDLDKMRASTTDPEVRKMKMGDGGYRLAYNIQYTTGTDSKVVYAVSAGQTIDPGTSAPMISQTLSNQKNAELNPAKRFLFDSAYSGADDVNECYKLFPNIDYIAPPKANKKCDPTKPRKGDGEGVELWRQNIENKEFKEAYKKRCSTSEFANAQVKNEGFVQTRVRGLLRVTGVAYLHAIVHNIVRSWDLTSKLRPDCT